MNSPEGDLRFQVGLNPFFGASAPYRLRRRFLGTGEFPKSYSRMKGPFKFSMAIGLVYALMVVTMLSVIHWNEIEPGAKMISPG